MDTRRQLSHSEQQEAMRSLQAGLVLAGLTSDQVSNHALALDGALSGPQTTAVLAGERACTAHEHNVLAQAINDHLVERGEDHPVRYSRELSDVGGD